MPRALLASLALAVLVTAPLLAFATPAFAATIVSDTIDGVTYTADQDAVPAGATVTAYAPGGLAVVIPSTIVLAGTTFTVTTIGAHAFQHLGVTSVSLPATITTVQDWAFDSMPDLTTVNYPDALTTIGEQAFSNNERLANPVFGTGLTSIGYAAFANSRLLTAVTIPATVTFIGTYAFGYNPDLVAVTFAGAVTTISADAFHSNENRLANVRFEGGAPGTIGTGALGNGDPLVRFSCAFASPAVPGGFTAPTWQGYRSEQAVPCPAPAAAPAPAGSTLADTGADAAGALALGAGGLLLAGATLLVAARRKSRA